MNLGTFVLLAALIVALALRCSASRRRGVLAAIAGVIAFTAATWAWVTLVLAGHVPLVRVLPREDGVGRVVLALLFLWLPQTAAGAAVALALGRARMSA